MPIDPARLKKLAGAKTKTQSKRFGLPPRPEVMDEPEVEDDDEAVAAENKVLENDDGEKGTPNPAAVIPFLEQYAEEVQACCDEIERDLLVDAEMEMDDESSQILQEGALMLPPRLQRLLPNFAGIEFEDAAVIADAMQDRGKTEDPEAWAGWIFRIGQLLDGADLGELGEEDDEE